MFFECIKKMFPLGHLDMKVIGQWLQSVRFLFGRNLRGSPIGQWLQTVSNIKHIRRVGC